MTDFNVAFRVRWQYESGAAKKTVGDLDQVAAQAKRLGAIDAGSKLTRDLKAAGGAAQSANRQFSAMVEMSAKLGGGVNRLDASLKVARLSTDALARSFGSVRTTAVASFGGASYGVEKLSRELQEATRRADVFERKLAEMERRAARFGHSRRRSEFGNEFLQTAGLGGALRFGMSGAAMGGVAAGGGVAAIGGALALSAREAIKFETAMAEVNKAVNDLSPEGLKAMERTILSASRTTGIAKEEMAKLVAQAGFAGRPAQELARFAEFGAKAAVAFDMTAEQTGDALAKMGNVFKLTQPQIEDLADGINTLGDSTAAKEKQIVDFLYRAGANGQAIGMTAHQVAAIGAAIISTGKEAEVAATGFNALAVKLSSPNLVHDKEFAKGLRSIGLSTRQLKAEMQVNPVEAYLKVLERINKLPQGKKLESAVRIGGMEYGDDLVAAAAGVDQIRLALAKMQDQAARSGSVEKTFKIFDATTERAINRATASMAAFATKLGQRFTPAVKDAAEWVAKLFDRMNNAADRADKVDAIATKLMRGRTLSKEDQDAVKADPALRTDAEAKAKATATERKRRAERGFFGSVWDMFSATQSGDAPDLARMPIGRGRRGLMQRRVDLPPIEVPAAQPSFWERWFGRAKRPTELQLAPGSGKRADLADGARVSLAAYNEEVDRQLERTERIVRRHTGRMREDLAISARVQTAVYGGGAVGGDGARIINASLGGGGGGGSGGGDGGWRSPPGHFGGIPRRSGGGRGGGGGGDVPDGTPRVNLGPIKGGGRGAYAKFDAKAPAIMGGLMKKYGLTKEQAAGIVGNLGHESARFTAYHEGGQAPGRGGVGWAQWTGSRRKDFERWTAKHHLDPTSDEASWRYLTEGDPETPRAIAAVKRTQTAHEAMVAFERSFERAGVKAYGSRDALANRAMRMSPVEGSIASAPPAAKSAATVLPGGWQKRAGAPAAALSLARPDPDIGSTPIGWSQRAGSGRFADPASMKLRSSPPDGTAHGGASGRAGGGSAHVTQHFHGGFDAHTVARRAQLEQNRAIRRSQAGALHDIGRVA